VSRQRFHGTLFDGQRILFGRVSGELEGDGRCGVRVGSLVAHVAGPPMLATNRPYRLALDDGLALVIYLTGLRADAPAGRPVLAFRVCDAAPA
jgi:hypothetical protein